MMNEEIKALSIVLNDAIEAREKHKRSLVELRVIAVEKFGFDQEMVQRSNVIDLLDGFVKGFVFKGGDDGR